MKDNKEAPLDGRSAGVHPIPEADSSPAEDTGASKLDEVVGAVMGDEPEVTAPGIAPDPDHKKDSKNP